MFVVCLNAWLAFHSVQVLDDSQYWVAHTWQVINTLERVISSMKDVESGDRGYLLTGDLAYLEPYTIASREIPREFHELLTLTSDNPRRQTEIAAMHALVDSRLSVLQSSINRFRAGDTDRAGLLIESGTGKAEMDRLRAMTISMQNEERKLLAQRVARSRRAKIDSQFTILLVSVIDILLITLILWLLNHERVLRQKTAATAERLSKLQSISDVGLTQLTFPQLVESLLERLRSVIQADGVVFCKWHEGEIEVAHSSGVTARPGLRVKLDADNPLYIAGVNRKVVTLEGAAAAALPLEGMRGEMYAILILPVLSVGEVAALLVAGRRGHVPFEDQDEDLLTVVADRIGMALGRANAYEAERRARQLAEKSAALAEKSAEEVRSLNAELEERVHLRTAELEASNRELEAFSYSVSHDLRSPLRSVDGFSLALEEDFAALMNDEGRDYIRRIRTGVQKMGQLIDSLLQLSRITRADLTREQVNVSDLAADVARDLRAENPGRNLTFRIEPQLEADADPRLLRIALENLLGNAVKFTARKPEAIIEVGRAPETGEFFVRDNGAGFDMRYVSKLFNAFQRLHGEREFAGSGIGLATVSRVIQRHLGTIRTEGAVDEGATFWFTVG
ncbi:MAG: CHASE3 domain-containing protein [Acidobacteriaceae bacterium]